MRRRSSEHVGHFRTDFDRDDRSRALREFNYTCRSLRMVLILLIVKTRGRRALHRINAPNSKHVWRSTSDKKGHLQQLKDGQSVWRWSPKVQSQKRSLLLPKVHRNLRHQPPAKQSGRQAIPKLLPHSRSSGLRCLRRFEFDVRTSIDDIDQRPPPRCPRKSSRSPALPSALTRATYVHPETHHRTRSEKR